MARPDQSDNQDIDQVARIVVTEESFLGSLRRVADTAVTVINRCDAASVTMSDDGRVSTWVSTDAAAERVDQCQYENDEGPCLDAMRTGDANFVDSLESDDRWKHLASVAVAEGMAALYSLPLKIGETTVGALNLYSRDDPFAFPDLRLAEALAAQAGVTLTNVQAYEQARDRISELEDALHNRGVSAEEEAAS